MSKDSESPLYEQPQFKDAARAAILKTHIDRACAQIVSGHFSRREATQIAKQAMKEVESLVGEDRELFDRIYGSRLRRLIEQFTTPDETQ
jgi:hypothetical protein